MEGVNPLGCVEVIRFGVEGIHIISILHLHQMCNEIAYKIVFSVVGLGLFHYAVLQKIDFFYFLETFVLGTLLQLDCCHLWFTRHDTLSQNDVLTQNSIIRVIIEVSRCNQTHPKKL